MSSAMKVTAPLVTAFGPNGRPVYLYRGDVVPDDTSKESLENLKSLGYVEPADGDVEADNEPHDDESSDETSSSSSKSTRRTSK